MLRCLPLQQVETQMNMAFRLFPMPFVLLALLTGIIGGLMRLGWALPIPQGAVHHGLLMTGGFLGTLITLERTVGMPSAWWRVFPVLSGLGTLLLLGGQMTAALVAFLLGGAGLIAVYLHQMTKHREPYWYILLAGAVCWTAGNLLLLRTGLVPASATWWVGFIFLTITGERLELTRYLPVPKAAKAVLWALLALTVAGLAVPFHEGGRTMMGAGLVLTALWLLRYDMARIGIRKAGFHRYVAIGLLVGYVWLVLTGLSLLLLEGHPLFYDIFLHTFFLGFAFSMIWSHAPIILPGVLKVVHRPYHPVLYVGWAVFQLSLMARMLAAWMGHQELRHWAAMVNGIVIVLMFLTMAGIMVRKARKKDRP